LYWHSNCLLNNAFKRCDIKARYDRKVSAIVSRAESHWTDDKSAIEY